MKIKTILYQHRRDFRAVFVCEHCGYEHERYGYDDTYFHSRAIPDMECPHCEKTAPETYRALATKYPDDAVV